MVDSLRAAIRTHPAESRDDAVERPSSAYLGAYAGPCTVVSPQQLAHPALAPSLGHLSAPSDLSVFGKRYLGFCQLIKSAQHRLQAKRRSVGWCLKMIQEIWEYQGTAQACEMMEQEAPSSMETVVSAAFLEVYMPQQRDLAAHCCTR